MNNSGGCPAAYCNCSGFAPRASREPGGRGRIRTFVARKERQIYSLLVLATHPPVPRHRDAEIVSQNRFVNTNRIQQLKHKTDSCPKTPARPIITSGNAPASLPADLMVELAEGI